LKGTISAATERIREGSVTFTAKLGSDLVFKGNTSVGKDGVAKVEFFVNDPKLWYPHGYGKQPLYDVDAYLNQDHVEVHHASRKIGFRKGELIQEKDNIGKSFYFRINHVDIFCGGSDWIPADNFTPRITEERYRKWLQTMVDGYQIMIR
jgi:beta-mannosidase